MKVKDLKALLANYKDELVVTVLGSQPYEDADYYPISELIESSQSLMLVSCTET